MGDEAQSLRADLNKTTTRIEELEAQLEALPSFFTASVRRYLQQSILALRKKKELLLQRLPPAQGAGGAQALTKYSRNSLAFSKSSRLRAAATLCMYSCGLSRCKGKCIKAHKATAPTLLVRSLLAHHDFVEIQLPAQLPPWVFAPLFLAVPGLMPLDLCSFG